MRHVIPVPVHPPSPASIVPVSPVETSFAGPSSSPASPPALPSVAPSTDASPPGLTPELLLPPHATSHMNPGSATGATHRNQEIAMNALFARGVPFDAGRILRKSSVRGWIGPDVRPFRRLASGPPASTTSGPLLRVARDLGHGSVHGFPPHLGLAVGVHVVPDLIDDPGLGPGLGDREVLRRFLADLGRTGQRQRSTLLGYPPRHASPP